MVPLVGPALRAARESLYLTVGVGVLAFQRVQVQRREWEQRLRGTPATTAEPADSGP
jgi:hypothetical protein